MSQTRALLEKTRLQNREVGNIRLSQQISKTDSAGSCQGYDAASGRYTVRSLAGSLQAVESVTTASFATGQLVSVFDESIDATPIS